MTNDNDSMHSTAGMGLDASERRLPEQGQYQALDALIEARITKNKGLCLALVGGAEVRQELKRLAKATGREEYRILDGRLQVLRKQKRIKHNKGLWHPA